MADRDSRAGATYATAEILAYAARVHAAHDAALERAFAAPDLFGMPAIQVGANEGRFLEVLLRALGARRVVEVGTLAGYSALWIARALPEGGHLWSLEVDAKHAAVARENLAAAGAQGRVTILVGKAQDLLPRLEGHGPFDAVFLDADKEGYVHYGRWAARHLRRGGLLLADNAFFFSRLLEESPEAAAVRLFHEEVARGFETACLPTPDGLLVGFRR